MTGHAESQYPEHEKLLAVKEQSQAVGEFLEWLGERGVRLMEWLEDVPEENVCRYTGDTFTSSCVGGRLVRRGSDCGECPRCHGTGFQTDHVKGWFGWEDKGVEHRLALFFGIDRKKLADEKDQMLAEIRRVNEERETARG